MRVRHALVFVALLGSAVAVLASPASAQTISVTTTADETSANGATSLREAFLWASANGQNDTIQLQAGAHYLLDSCAAGPLTHTAPHALTIQGGAGTTLQNVCIGMQTIVDTDGTAGLTINSLEMTGFSVDDGPLVFGAAVSNENGGALALNNVEIHGFSSGGGNIVNGGDFGTHATITNSEIWGNQGTGLSLSFGSVTLNNSQVHDNVGSGISLTDGTPVNLTGSSVNDNTGNGLRTTGQGHTVVSIATSHIDGNGEVGLSCGACKSVSITGSNINANGSTTTTGGGGVRTTWDYDDPTDAPVLSITNSVIAYNRAVTSGGGVGVTFIEDSDPTATPGALNISGSNISGNSTDDALDADGGGIFANTGNITITNGSVINGNTAGTPAASADGGGIWQRELADLNGTRALTITDSTVNDNTATGSGGGLYAAHNGFVRVTGSTLNNNTAEGSSGGAMATAGTATSVGRSKVQGNEADVGGGMAHGSFSGLPVGSVTVDRSTLSGNHSTFAASGGGGLFVNVGGAGAQATVRNSTVTDNVSANYGGGLMVMQTSRLFLDHATVVHNTGSTGANVYVAAGTFRTRRAAIALAAGSGDNCAFFSAPAVNDGYSWADDTSCNLGGNDVEAPGVDPMLGPLANNGGPTPTRKPAAHTPLAIVPAGQCTLVIDQRGTTRPQGNKCEAGALEITEVAPK